MKKAWEWTRELVLNGTPFPGRMGSVSWAEVIRDGQRDVAAMNSQWKYYVTDSLAQMFNMAGTIQAKANLGYDLSKAEEMLEEGKRLYETRNEVELYKHTLRVMREIAEAPKDQSSPYWNYKQYTDFEQYENSVSFPHYDYDPRKVDPDIFRDKIYASWIAQVAAGAVGTALEGYHTTGIERAFGIVDGYIKEPEQYNDDITFQLVFLEAFSKSGYNVTSAEIAEEWVARIPMGFTAEGVALRNLKQGIYPPKSGYHDNPMREWIGAQMRGAVCGIVAPGNPYLAAKLAFKDAQISHSNSGILGEVFNAIMVSLGFVENNCRKIVRLAIDMIPADSLYRSVVEFAWNACENHSDWKSAWLECDEEFKHYNWVSALPNAAAQVVSLYFCDNDYDKLCTLVAMCGLDVDCNAAQVACVLAVMQGMSAISPRWTEPLGNAMITYVRGMENVRYNDLTRKTINSVHKALEELDKA